MNLSCLIIFTYYKWIKQLYYQNDWLTVDTDGYP